MTKIYESSDGGKTVYVREMGGKEKKIHYVSPSAVEDMKETLLVQEWMEIRHAAERHPALQKSVDHCKLLYRMIKYGSDS
jgi:hypothetical protein